MRTYFTAHVTNEERENILNQHREVYDGYVTQYAKTNEQPLYVQDLANDKGGITLSNKGNVTTYKNVGINEMKHDGKDTGLFSDEANEDVYSGSHGFEPEETFESEEESVDEMMLDTIGDGPLDFEHGTVDNGELDDEEDTIEIDFDETLMEQIERTKDMFKRFGRY
jgi:hypothetical protein